MEDQNRTRNELMTQFREELENTRFVFIDYFEIIRILEHNWNENIKKQWLLKSTVSMNVFNAIFKLPNENNGALCAKMRQFISVVGTLLIALLNVNNAIGQYVNFMKNFTDFYILVSSSNLPPSNSQSITY